MDFKTKTLKSMHLCRALLLGSVLTSPLCAISQVLAITLTSSQYQNITGITTANTPGTSSSFTAKGGGDSSYPSGTNYTVNFAGATTSVTTFTTSSGTGTVSTALPATFTIRRSPTSDLRQTVWYQGSQSGTALNLQAGGPITEDAALGGNNILVGSDNLFVNTGNGANNQTADERLDFVTSAITVGNTRGFAILERGASNGHDQFKIAAITSVDANNNPTAYGTLYTVASGWGTTPLGGASNNYYVLNNTGGNTAAPRNPSATVAQTIGGIFISTDLLATAGTQIYGYSLFNTDTPDNCANLVDITNNTTCFPTNSADASATTSGIDLVGVNLGAVSYRSNAVPFGFSPGLGILALGVWGTGIKLERKLRNRGMAKTPAKQV